MVELLLCGIRASYSVALRAQNAVILMIYGRKLDSFKMLPKYLEVLSQYNPDTMTDLDIGPDDLWHLFIDLGIWRVAFQSSLRQVIIVDDTHLKGKNKSVLFVVVTKDGNKKIFPLAIGIGPIKNDESWTWFLTRLLMAFGCNDQLLIISY